LAGKRAYDVFLDCFHQGVLVRSAGDNLVLAPAYVVNKAQIEQMVGVLAAAIKRLA
jgi:beta-alanine--pyruvate transaminase